MSKKSREPHEILTKELERLRRKNPSFSLRALARDLSVSPSFLSDVLKGKRPFPKKRLPDFIRALRMDSIAADLLVQAVERAALNKAGVADRQRPAPNATLGEYEQLNSKDYFLLKKWYFVAALDLMTCKDAVLEEEWLAKRLRISRKDAREAIDTLVKAGWIVRDGDAWKKATERVRFPTRNSEELIRNFHRQMIQLASKELRRTDAASFQRRLINGLTFAANPKNLERAKDHLNRALYEAVDILMEGECTDVYQLNCQLFGLTHE